MRNYAPDARTPELHTDDGVAGEEGGHGRKHSFVSLRFKVWKIYPRVQQTCTKPESGGSGEHHDVIRVSCVAFSEQGAASACLCSLQAIARVA